MMLKQFVRYVHSQGPLWASASKSDLAKLRKKTGYTFANCKKALEVNNNDVNLAEKWLKEQAQAMGWMKATKLEGRATLQGLIGLSAKGNSAVALEINCETDFVARNKSFKNLVELSASAFLKETLDPPVSSVSKNFIDSLELKKVTGPENKSLADHTALAISSLGENITLRRGVTVKVPSDIFLVTYAHPKPENPSAKVLVGKYGAIVAYQTTKNDSRVQEVAQQICQHIVGMDPSKIGTIGEDEPHESKDDETVMIHQEFLLDPSVTVGQVIQDAQIKIIDFVRFECGETQKEDQIEIKASQCG